ncbi:MAG: SDR family oxidoreductase [Acidimicrobiales bacterium]|nr:SDR family oxidoreductase [Acidimicrobiales bacterium]
MTTPPTPDLPPARRPEASLTNQPFLGRTAIVTGAAGDIGGATAVRLAAAGARVVLADVTDAVEVAAARCAEANATATPVTLVFDVTDADAVRSAFEDLAAQDVTADLLFNNAGYQGHFSNVVDYDITDFRRVLDINVTGVFLVLQSFARHLISAGRPGAIVNSASMAHGGAPNMAAYSASKAAVIALTKTAAKDLAHHTIRVNSISPALIGPGEMWNRQVRLQATTPSQYFSDRPDEVAEQMIGTVPLRRYGSLDEVAAAVQFLLSDDASYITAFDIEVSGGAN